MRHNGRVSEPVDFTSRTGGPVGRRASRAGIWFNPAFFAFIAATLSWLIVTWRQVPCRPLPGDEFPNAFMRLCYSDIPTLYLNRDLSLGSGIYTDISLEYPVLTGGFVALARMITRGLGAVIAPGATMDEQLAASQIFFQVNAVLLFICFLVAVRAHLAIGRDSPEGDYAGPARTWDALLIAASPIVMLNGLINWDMLAVMLTSIGLLVWGRKRPFWAGVVLGLAFAAKFYPVLILIAITVICVRADRYRPIVQAWLGAVIAWTVVNVPVMIFAWQGWSQFWTLNADRGSDLGSIWYVLTLAGLEIPQVTALSFVCMALGGIGICWLVLNAPRRPRLAQIVLLLLLCFLIFNKVYSPQYALWLLPVIVLARPKAVDVGVWTAGEALYYLAIWGFLEGKFGIGTDWEWIYWLAVIVRIGVQLWIGLRVIDDIRMPWSDPVRLPMVDDPLGGVVNHASDAPWLVAVQDRAARRTRARQARWADDEDAEEDPDPEGRPPRDAQELGAGEPRRTEPGE